MKSAYFKKIMRTGTFMIVSMCFAGAGLVATSLPAYAIDVADFRAEDLLLQAIELKKILNLTPNQQALWQQVEAKVKPILRTRQSRREALQLALRTALVDPKTELRDWSVRINSDEELSRQENLELRELSLGVNDALDDGQRALVLNFLLEQLQRPAFNGTGVSKSETPKPREEKHERGGQHRKQNPPTQF